MKLRPISSQPTPLRSPMVNNLGEKLLLRPSATTSEPQNPILPLKLADLPSSKRRILDFDIETRRVGFHSAGKFKPEGCEPTTIAVSWVGESAVQSILIGASPQIPPMLEWFSEFYDAADIVTGHYIRKFDLPILNGALLEWGLNPLAPKLVIDTKVDMIDTEGWSGSQENLSIMLRLDQPKYHMADADWRRATRLTSGGQERSRKRAESDVRQHKALMKAMQKRKMLRPPRVWAP
jgi:hypothetical protein